MTVRILHYADVENAYDTPERVGRLAGAIDALRDDPAATLVTGGGDDTAPGVLSLACEGAQAQEFFDAVEPDVEVFGNHDFDHGYDAARRAAREFPGAWLNANAHHDGERFAADHTTPTALLDVGDATVGFVGVTAESTPDINPVAADLAVGDAVDAVRDAEHDLRDAGADHVVVVSHRGEDEDIARETTVDAVLGGHEHDRMADSVEGTLVARPGSGGHTLLEVTLSDGDPTATHRETADYPVDEAVAAALRERMAETVTRVDGPVRPTERHLKAGESPVGNFVADALRSAGGADVALLVGGIRQDDPLDGDVTVADLHGLCPFDNEVLVTEVDGATLLDAFADLQLAAVHPGDDVPDWWFGHVSGASLVYDDRDYSVVGARVGGEPVHPEETYEVALSDYHVVTDHIVRAIDEDDVVRAASSLSDALVERAREHGVNTETEGRIRRPYLEEPAVQ